MSPRLRNGLLLVMAVVFGAVIGVGRADGEQWAGIASAVLFTAFLAILVVDWAGKRRRRRDGRAGS